MTNSSSMGELRKAIMIAGTVRMASFTVSRKMYSNNTVSPLESKNQEIVEIGIDDLIDLITRHQNQILEDAIDELKINRIDMLDVGELGGKDGKSGFSSTGVAYKTAFNAAIDTAINILEGRMKG